MATDKIFEAELMTKQFLYDYQYDAVDRMKNGCILNGGVGSGKSRTGLYYYFKEQGGSIIDREYIPMKNPKDLLKILSLHFLWLQLFQTGQGTIYQERLSELP